MELRPILSALLRNRTRAVLIALQVAMTLAIVSNALFMIDQRLKKMARPTGIDVEQLIYVSTRSVEETVDYYASVAADKEALRAIPGVTHVASVSDSVLGGSGNGECFTLTQDEDAASTCAARLRVDEYGLETLGLNLVAGRDFTADEVELESRTHVGYPPVAIVTQAFADQMFPQGDALGSRIYNPTTEITIVGIVDVMLGPWLNSTAVERNMLQPALRRGERARYLIRTEAGMRDRLVPAVEETLKSLDANRIFSVKTQSEILDGSYQSDSAMTWLLTIVILLLVAVTALGVVGLANASVNKRIKQIGTRRALGATRPDIVRYFMVENGLVTAGGILLGSVLALGVNYWLVNEYEFPRLELWFLAAGIGMLFVLGQLAVLAPARRASLVEPAIATRTV